MPAHKTRFCPKGHDKDVEGRDKDGSCVRCEKDRQHRYWTDDAKVVVLRKEFCINGHDIAVVGRTKDRHCKGCARKYVEDWTLENAEHVKEWFQQWYIDNKEEILKHQKESRDMDKPRFTGNTLKSRYKITLEGYNKMLESQGYLCLGCLRHQSEFDVAFPVDHDHSCCSKQTTCGKCIRGLLCSNCNRILGQAKDLSSTLRRLADYLDAWNLKKANQTKEIR